jgi:hypothetical protein
MYVFVCVVGEKGRTLTEYCLPARIQGDSVKLKNISAGSSSTLICDVIRQTELEIFEEKTAVPA